MSHTLFISDLHLAPERPQITDQFLAFARDVAPGAESLYVLGDLFEYWIGDDDFEQPLNRQIGNALARLVATGTAVYFMHGNRDVLVGEQFARRSGMRLLGDPTLADLYGTPTLLLHGDTLCVDDLAYQKFRAYAHDPKNQAQFLALPAEARRERMRGWRAESESSKLDKTDEIMDVSPAAVEQTLRSHGYPRMIHGHTHRPARHVLEVDGRTCERWVLADWYRGGSYLRCDAAGCTAVTL